MHKKWILDRRVNNILLKWKLTCILRIYKTCNSMVEFSKYEFNNKLLGDVTYLGVTQFLDCRFLIDLIVKKIALNAN